ncbi:putative cytochrome p450 monooxygenase protein [Eutypa lata UCREL1]|uniref:Putative cytochrome p450 monooxygenase protein n=1 Tax=Eutypa lata (strain UCR-EL1) TaxID=1287681 RepID=M7T0K6_EUTLA|nr:putative cytochrome p450 monooxygenase protein [Eutypa lata UCREL1]
MALAALGLTNIIVLTVGLSVLYVGGYVVYNLFFHPLARYPGPLLMRGTRLGLSYKMMKGTISFDVLDLHKRYGEVVRIAPNELAFSNSVAWKDIMGHRAQGTGEFEKWDGFYRPVKDLPTDIVNASREEHGAIRRTLANGFSDRSMREQQPIIKGYIDLLISRLHDNCKDGAKTLDIAAWYNYTTFDVIGDLAFGESFGCLDNSDYHVWVKTIFRMARVGTILQVVKPFPLITKMLLAMAPKAALEERDNHMAFTRAKLVRRMESGKERPDLVEGLLKKQDEWGLTMEKLQANSSILIIGGSETTATLLSGVTYFLLMNPEPMAKLTAEIRGAFKSEDEIDFVSVSSLQYLLACLDEALRMYPPVPTGLPRVVPKGGASISGNFIPEDPFHLGARNCLGRNLAYVEMRLILARVLWNFDMTIADESKDWVSKQKIFNLWEKGPLLAYLTPVSR